MRRIAAVAMLALAGVLSADGDAVHAQPAAPVENAAASAPVEKVGASAPVARPTAEDPVLERRLIALTKELRCLVCQNESIADSHAPLAVDMRNQIREQLRSGMSDRQVIEFMVARYGDFVRFRPPLQATTVALWFGPALLLLAGLAVLAVTLRRRARVLAMRQPGQQALSEAERAQLARLAGDAVTRAATPGQPSDAASGAGVKSQ